MIGFGVAVIVGARKDPEMFAGWLSTTPRTSAACKCMPLIWFRSRLTYMFVRSGMGIGSHHYVEVCMMNVRSMYVGYAPRSPIPLPGTHTHDLTCYHVM